MLLLLVTFVCPQIAGLPLFKTAFVSRVFAIRSAKSAAMQLESFLKSNQLRPSGARNPWREERRHGKCGDWRTSLSYSALRSQRKLLAVNTLVDCLSSTPK